MSAADHDLRERNLSPPANVQLEQGLLGCILIYPDVIDEISFLRAEHFSEAVHAAIYAAMLDVIAETSACDGKLVAARLRDVPDIDVDMPIWRYIGILATAACARISAANYARSIIALATRRTIRTVGFDLAETASRAPIDAPPLAMIADAEARLFAVAASNPTSVDEQPAQIINRVCEMAREAHKAGGRPFGLATHLNDIDAQMMGLRPGNLIIIAGRPSIGKTGFSVGIAFYIADRYRRFQDKQSAPVLVFSMEMSADELWQRIIGEQVEIPANRIQQGKLSGDELERIEHVRQRIAETPLYVDESGGLTIGELALKARRAVRKHKVGLIVIDYLQLMRGSGENRNQEITEITTGLKALAKELKVPIIALSQLSRATEKRDDKRPQLSDLRESGAIEQDADVVMFLFRAEYYVAREQPSKDEAEKYLEWQARMKAAKGKAEVIFAKIRYGATGIVTVAFDAELTRFSNYTDREGV